MPSRPLPEEVVARIRDELAAFGLPFPILQAMQCSKAFARIFKEALPFRRLRVNKHNAKELFRGLAVCRLPSKVARRETHVVSGAALPTSLGAPSTR